MAMRVHPALNNPVSGCVSSTPCKVLCNRALFIARSVRSIADPANLRGIAVKRHDALEARLHRQEVLLATIVSKFRVSVNAERHHLASQLGEIFDLVDGFADVVLSDNTIWVKTQRDIAALAK